ncbi:11-beta-hydroxysteroid dehydrogenase B-like protein [Drosera capensis]
MDLMNSLLNLVVPPASLVMLALAWPTLSFIHACEWVYGLFNAENMEDKVVIITGAASGIGERIAYEYAKRGAILVLVARREDRLRGISEKARRIGAKHVMIVAADVVKEDECRRFISEAVNFYGRVDHLVNATSLGHMFYFEEANDTSVFPHLMDINFWGNVYPTYVALSYLKQSRGRIIVNASVENWLPLPRMSLYSAAKAALINFYESLRLEVKDEVGITIATHGWVGSEIASGKLMPEDNAEMQWREDREVHVSGGPVEEYASLIVDGACRGEPYVKYPNWYDTFLLYRVFAPKVLGWAMRMLLATERGRRTSFVGVGKPLLEASSPRKPISRQVAYPQLQKLE